MGKSYDYVGVAGAGTRTWVGWVSSFVSPALCVGLNAASAMNAASPDSKFYRSELVVRSFEEADAPILNVRARQSQPGELATSHFLVYVGHLKGE